MEQPRNHRQRVFVLVVDAIVGGGKSTLIYRCLLPYFMSKGYKVVVIGEPVEQWQKSGLFEKFYSDMKRWAYTFQTKAFQSRVRLTCETYEKYGDSVDIYILERSIFSDRLFVEILVDQGLIDSMEKQLYDDWWSEWKRIMPIQPNLFLYFKPSVKLAMERVEKRARSKEEVSGVTSAYQSLLAKKHDEHFGGQSFECEQGLHIPCRTLISDAEFETDPIEKEKLCSEIFNLCHSMGLDTLHQK